MWVRTTLTIERWTKEKTEPKARSWDESRCRDVNRLPSWERGHLLAGVASSTDVSTFSEGDCKEPDKCCWRHKQCTGHIIYPFASDCVRHSLYLHSVNHCNCNSRLKDCSEDSSSSRGAGPTCSHVIESPCFELTPEEEHVERFQYGWCKSYRPVSVAVIHHPLYHECGADDLNEEEEEEEEESKPPIRTQVGPATASPDLGTSMATGTPDSTAPITIWRSESPTGKGQGSKVIKKVKKKEKEKDKEEMDEKAKLKKKAKKGQLTKKKSPVKLEPSPPDVSRSLSPRQLARMSESSPESREELESEDSYNGWGQGELSSEDIVESSSPRKREKNTVQAKKTGAKPSQARKVNKRKSPPGSNPNLS
ncbi:protein PROCA1 isoform X1 [Gorilla gorilla gorilla]|uniref:protein PROCA1 isoform X1 n=1 Tax=Gorilla gorilla gorilla TaxID=9595 RepID=UPI0008F488AD|nr:protein PROCA1 isoform X1 [Gorilla gorilla gorilla]